MLILKNTSSFVRRRVISVFLILFLGGLTIGCGGENVKWHGVGTALIDEIYSVLLEGTYCKSEPECRKRKIVLFKPTSDGLEIDIYGLLDSKLLAQVAAKCASAMVAREVPVIQLSVFGRTKQEIINSPAGGIFGEREVIKLKFEANYANH